jgi:phosphodiesterase/alkaline phosphatase D-like protein
VQVDAQGLQPGQQYYYAFTVQNGALRCASWRQLSVPRFKYPGPASIVYASLGIIFMSGLQT